MKHTVWASPRENYLVSIDGTALRLKHHRKHMHGDVEVDRVYEAKEVGSKTAYGRLSFGKYDQQKMHRLVAELFIGGRDEINCQVLHKDDDAFNNSIENLYWGNFEDNLKDSIKNSKRVYKVHSNCDRAKHKPLEIRKGKFMQVFDNIKEAKEFIGVSASAISQALKKGRKTGGYEVRLV